MEERKPYRFKTLLFPFIASALLLGCGKANSSRSEASASSHSSAVSSSDQTPSGGSSSTAAQTEESQTPIDSSCLVAYFSVTNNTEMVANTISSCLSSALYEIEPKVPYTREDIDYTNGDSRSSKEQNDPSSRPEIGSQTIDISSYETIFLGYPIWWGQAPKILYTFVESYDFSNKTIIPFCTSASSSIGSSATNLAKSASTANWLEGKRFSSDAKESEITNWVESFDFSKQEEEEMTLENIRFTIDQQTIDIDILDNVATNGLLEKLKEGAIDVAMHRYGGFEQVGSLGTSLPSADVNITTGPGDVVLYSSNQIVIFFGSNTWDYTKLGHINLGQEELRALLDKENVSLKIDLA